MQPYNSDPQTADTLKALWKLTKVVLETLDYAHVTQKICDSLLEELGYLNLGYRIIVLSLYSEKDQGLRRIALSQTPEAAATMAVSTIPFHDIVIPLTATDNYCVKAFLDQQPHITHDFKDILSPPLEPEAARTNQRAAGIKTSMVYPVILKGKSIGIVIFSMIKQESEVAETEKDLLRGFTDIVGIAVQNSQMYSELQEANIHLKELDKMKDQLIAVASHELRTPASIVQNYLWSLISKPDPATVYADKDKDRLQRSHTGIGRLIELVNEILNVARLEGGKMTMNLQPVDAKQLIVSTADQMKVKAEEKGLELKVDSMPEGEVIITADPLHVGEVMTNLVSNSIKFTDHGSVTIKLEVKDNEAMFSITDTGKGIAKEHLPLLFKKFQREDTTLQGSGAGSGGTGLGLYISKSMVELMHGKIWVDSDMGKGATFAFSLPLAQGQSLESASVFPIKGTKGIFNREEFLKRRRNNNNHQSP